MYPSTANFRFKLQPYKPGQKQTCPQCGQAKCYVRYYDTETNALLPYEYGRCERINSCNYHKAPDKPIASEIYASEKEVKTEPLQHVNSAIVHDTFKHYDQNIFALWLAKTFGAKVAAETIRKYDIGTAKNGGTIFWYRDIKGNYRTGKKMFYKPDGHRLKEPPPSYVYLVAKGYRPCLYGEHLITQGKPVAVVESEKTAIIASVYRPELTWVAAGGANGLTHEKCGVLNKMRVLLFPDYDKAGRDAFNSRMPNLRQNAFPEIIDIIPECSDGTDIADLLLLTPLTAPDKLIINADGYPATWET